MVKELRVDGIFYLQMKENETMEEAVERFNSLISNCGIVETDECSFEECDN